MRKNKWLVLFYFLSSFSGASSTGKAFQTGESIFRSAGGYGCSTCHGLFAEGGGNIGGNIRGKSLQDIETSLKQEESMKLLDVVLTPQNKKHLAFYLKALGKLQLIDWTLDTTPFEKTFTIKSKTKSQLVVSNKTFEPISIDLSPISKQNAKLDIAPYETKSFEWSAEKGSYLLCYNNQKIHIEVN